MRIHLVCDRAHADRILPRFARYLAQRFGWPLANVPDPAAELNHFVGYITWRQRFSHWHATPMSAYFSHRDYQNPTKAQWWDDSAREMDLRLTMAEMYAGGLREQGTTVMVRPAVELDRFIIAKRPRRARPVVGVSGYTYGDGRKGEGLIERLAQSELGARLEMRGSGRGWAVPTKGYAWRDMPGFYQGLDVLVCPSIIEGVPMPPLEALACGIKVVVPTGVGMLDELPQVEGIHRYRAGHYQGFERAVEEAAFGPGVDRRALRGTVDEYSVENYCQDHVEAFERLLYGIPMETVDLPDWRTSAGVYLVAFGVPSRKCAERAIKSIKRWMPELPIAVVSDRPVGGEDVAIQQADRDIGGRIAKMKVYDLAPEEWKYILYLDADTEVVGDVGFLFQILQDGWEMAICKDMHKYHTAKMMLRPDNAEEAQATWDAIGSQEALQYNGGMMAVRRCPRVRRFFDLWQEEWGKWRKRDQGALLRALHGHPLRVMVLSNLWNATDRYPLPCGEIAIMHHNTEARRWEGLIEGPIDGPEAWRAVRMWERAH